MAKGGEYERKVCKQLSRWYAKGMLDEERSDIFWRTAGSGARATTRMKKNKTTADSYGDVCSIHPEGKQFTAKCLLELKRGYTPKYKEVKITRGKNKGKIKKQKNIGRNDSISLLHMVDRVDGKAKQEPLIIRWLDKANKEAKAAGIEHAAIIFQRDLGQSCILIQYNTWNMLLENNRSWTYPNDGQMIFVGYHKHSFIVLRLLDFLAWCPPQAFFEKVPQLARRKKSRHKFGKYTGRKVEKLRRIK